MSGSYHMKRSKEGTSACPWGSNLSSEHICALPNLVKNNIDREKERERKKCVLYVCMYEK